MHVRALGRFEVSVGSRIIEEGAWRLRKAQNLVKLLVLAPEHRLHREQAMDLLWPDLAPRAAANNLHQALHVARRVLEPQEAATPRYLRLHEERLALCPDSPLWVDVEAFEEAAITARRAHEPASYRAAIDLYAGDLLPDDRYEGWAESRRTELRKSYLDLLVEMAGFHEKRGWFGLAVEALRETVTAEPAHERAHAGLIRLYARTGQRYQALRQYEQLREALRRELDTEPDASSRLLHEEVMAGRIPTAGTPASSPPREPSDADRHNLPISLTSFVGQEREKEEIERLLLGTARLLTLTGIGGSGKTRLAVEVARKVVGAYPRGVWLVELAPLAEGELVPQVVAGALMVYEQPNRPLADTLADAIGAEKMLLVLDNCEHLLDASAHLAETLLSSCPGLQILATSQEVLGVPGEVIRQVPPLSQSDPQHPPTVEELTGFESTRLFIERASLRQSNFVPTPENAEVVARICRKLDGIPFAIELAAARVGALAVEQISERLEDSLELLKRGSRTVAPRQQTLRGALDWSYKLLDKPEKRLFDRLSVFVGGWTLAAAEVVVRGEDDTLDLLSRLVDKSLVVAEASVSVRYRLLDFVRQYGRERLEAAKRRRPGADTPSGAWS